MYIKIQLVVFLGVYLKHCSRFDHEYVPFVVLTIRSCPHSWHHRVGNKSTTTGATSGAVTTYPFRTSKFTPGFSEVRDAWSLVFCVHSQYK